MITEVKTVEIVQNQKKTNWFATFSGLIPLALMVPFLILHVWVVCIVLAIGGSLLLLISGFTKTRTVSSLQVLTLLFGIANAVLYFGFQTVFLLTHLGAVIYSVLFVQVALSLLRGKPWTEEYARRSATPEAQKSALFHETNMFLTGVWGASFLASALVTLLGSGLWATLVSFGLLVLSAVSTPILVKVYLGLRLRA